MRRSDLITIGILVAIVAAVGLYAWYQQNYRDPVEALQDLPTEERAFIATEYQTLTGEPVSLEQFAGDVLVVNSWASWCPFCVQELADFATLAAQYREQGVQVIAINRSEEPTTAVAYLQSVGVTTNAELRLWLDEQDAFYKGIGGFTMPETIFYNRDGTVHLHKRGFMQLEEMERIVSEITQSE